MGVFCLDSQPPNSTYPHTRAHSVEASYSDIPKIRAIDAKGHDEQVLWCLKAMDDVQQVHINVNRALLTAKVKEYEQGISSGGMTTGLYCLLRVHRLKHLNTCSSWPIVSIAYIFGISIFQYETSTNLFSLPRSRSMHEDVISGGTDNKQHIRSFGGLNVHEWGRSWFR